MFRRLTYMLVILVALAGCAGPTPTARPAPTDLPPSPTLTASPASTFTPIPTLAPSPTATLPPTPTFTPTVTPTGRIPIIEYHDPEFRLSDQVQMTLDWFAEQMAFLANNGYHTLSAEELVAYLDGSASFPEKSVVITFDVGTAKKQNYNDVVIPTLKKYGFKAIFFIVSNDTVEVEPCKQERRFCWEDFRQWAQDGLISIGSHGLFHPDFTKLSAGEIRYELDQSRKILADKTGQTPLGFAFPFDATNAAAQNLVKAAGYDFAVAGNTRKDLVVFPADPDRYHLPRLYPYSNTRIYPMLTGYNHPFGEVVAAMIQPPAVTGQPAGTPPASTPASGTPAAGTPAAITDAQKFVDFCRSLPTNTAARFNILLNTTFQTDISPQAQARLPGLSTSPSCNFFGVDKPEAIVLHYTVGDLNSSMYAFRQAAGASSHYIIDRDGKIYQMVPEEIGALHANCNGTRSNCLPSCPICDGKDGALTEPYSRSIGIEIVNRGHIPTPGAPGTYYEDYLRSFSNYSYWEEYTDAQIASLKILVQDIATRWNIPVDPQHILGHYRVNFKVDPGPALNLFWTRAGFPPRPPIFDPPQP